MVLIGGFYSVKWQCEIKCTVYKMVIFLYVVYPSFPLHVFFSDMVYICSYCCVRRLVEWYLGLNVHTVCFYRSYSGPALAWTLTLNGVEVLKSARNTARACLLVKFPPK